MNKRKNEEDYLEAFREHQDKQYLPGYYLGGKILLGLKSKTKAGGYLMVCLGIFLFLFYLFLLVLDNFSGEIVGLIAPLVFAILLMMVGIKFIRINTPKDKD